ncbi:MAG: DUF6044 family protein [Oscillospiraceae bacterium]|jgi:hypothetical protein|nr:DUF6044 family protein [Oscillospiraceae bacterium]
MKSMNKLVKNILNIKNAIVNIFVFLIAVIAITPLIYYGKDSIIQVFDNLDSVVPWIKMQKDTGLLFAINSPTNVMGNMSTAYFMHHSFNLLYILYAIFDVFTAHILGFSIKVLAGFISMYLLLRYLFPDNKNNTIFKLVSIAFALLPSLPIWWLSIDTVPLLCLAFLYFMKINDKFDKRILLLLFFPFLSNFGHIGIFLLAFWVLCTIIVCIINKKLNINLIIGFFCLLIGFIIIDLRLFYSVLFLNEPTNRLLYYNSMSLFDAFTSIPSMWFDDFLAVSYHAPHIAQYVIIPFIFITLTVISLYFLYRVSRNETQIFSSEQKILALYSTKIIMLLSISVVFAAIGTLYYIQIISNIIHSILPFLIGFNWGRIVFLNRIVLYVCFAFTLIILPFVFKKRLFRLLIYFIAVLQIVVVLLYPTIYNYSRVNISHFYLVKRDHHITYNEFFAVELFSLIKKDLQYDGEGVAALGYHPSILMYNGFSTVDGYLSVYPLSRMIAFREIIEPQLERNHEHRDYYDAWGGRMYLYNDDLSFQPTRTNVEYPVNLYINTEAFRNLGGVYILSRAEIANSDELDLTFINSYTIEDSIYEIYVYLASVLN